VLDRISVQIGKGEIVSIVGPSGCGKSTFLRIIAGLLKPTSGEVFVNGRCDHDVSPEITMIFQRSTLFPWLTVVQNIQFGLKARMQDEAAIREKSLSWLQTVEIGDYADRYPFTLSGGMSQRASLARALAISPSILLLDEPFSSLDAISRQEMHEVLLRLWSEQDTSIVLVTHDVDEAVTLSDRIILMTPRPARLSAEFTVDLPRPRTSRGVRCAGFEDVRNRVSEMLTLRR
jgi:ABC-type nitrate/sulfonate/bicarbonate transport system ATPase subunit